LNGDDHRIPSRSRSRAAPSASEEHRALLERVERALRGSRERLSNTGKDGRVSEMDRWSSWIRLTLDHPATAAQLSATIASLADAQGDPRFLDRALEGAIALLGAEAGNIQLVHPVTRSLRIAVQYGFGRDFLDYFAEVDDDGSACGRAAHARAQTVITDVQRDPAFAPHREIAAASGFRAVQSTPMIDPSGRLLGIISTHFPRPHRPTRLQLQLVDWYAHRLAALVSSTGPQRSASETNGRFAARSGHAA
jgi:hypothetical protein